MKKGFYLALLAAFILIAVMLYEVFMIVPNEKTMGAVQRIFYFHVGSAISCYFSICVVLLGSVIYLRNRKTVYDALAEAAGECGLLFSTIVLATGMIWGHAAWNSWFRWEPRLVSFLLLWLIFLAFVVLRIFGDPVRIASHSAILGITGSVMVPIVMFSVRLLPGMSQLHPKLESSADLAPEMRPAFFLSIVALVMLQFVLLFFRTRLGVLERDIEGGDNGA